MIDRLRKVVIVCGKSNTGKTSAIKLAMEKLGVNIGSKKVGDQLFAGFACSTGSYLAVGISSGGDTREIVEKNIEFFENVGLQLGILVIACKSRGESMIAAQNFARTREIDLVIITTKESKKHQLAAEIVSNEICRQVF